MPSNNKPLNESEIKQLKDEKDQSNNFNKTMRNIIIQLIFLTLLFNVSNLTQDSSSFKYQDYLNKFFSNGINTKAIKYKDVIIHDY